MLFIQKDMGSSNQFRVHLMEEWKSRRIENSKDGKVGDRKKFSFLLFVFG